MNDIVYEIASFMVMRNPVNWRWSHARHHTDTIIVGRDAEIGFMHQSTASRSAPVGGKGIAMSFATSMVDSEFVSISRRSFQR